MSRLMLVLLGVLAMTASGCSGSDNDTKLDSGSLDLMVYHDMATTDGGEAACGPEVYPCGPYGTNIGDVAANLEFVGYMDPQNHCKDHADKVMDTNTKVKISFKDWYLGDPSCPTHKKKLLWVIVSAGWCGPCILEVMDTQSQYANGLVSEQLGILNIVFETDNYEPVTDAFIKNDWINDLNLTMPVAMDPSFKMGAYFSAKATPFNMLVETENGQIYYRQVGGVIDDVGAKMQEYFSTH